MKRIIKEAGEIGKAAETGKIGKTVEIGKNRLRTMCDRLSPQKRFVVVISSLIVFAMMAIYMAISSIYFLQRPELEIKHIEGLKLPRANNDSINTLKFSKHDQYEEY
jgi:hypothetical protein